MEDESNKMRDERGDGYRDRHRKQLVLYCAENTEKEKGSFQGWKLNGGLRRTFTANTVGAEQ